MNEQAKAARRAYKRKWAKQNPEKVKGKILDEKSGRGSGAGTGN